MQIPKSYALFCAAVLAASPLCAQNVNADADAKAREALRRKISELEGKPLAPDSSAPSAPAANAPQPAPPVSAAPAASAPAAPPTAVSSDAAEKAREALRQKIADLQTKPAAPPPATTAEPPPVVVTPAPAPTPTPAPVVVTPEPAPTPAPAPVVVTPAPAPAPAVAPAVVQPVPAAAPANPAAGRYNAVVTPGLDPDAEAKAREALREKLANKEGQPTAAAPSPLPVATPPQYVNTPQPTPTPAVTPAPAPVAVAPAPVAAAPAAIVAAPVATPVFVEAVPVGNRPDSEAEARAREALRQKMQELSGTPAVGNPPAYPVQPPSGGKTPNVVTPTPPTIPTGGNVLVKNTGSKERRLDDLLRLYKADQITPQEYHIQRAKIIAEP